MEYFTISELTKSDTATRKGIKNVAGREEEDNLRALVGFVLDPLRRTYGKTIRISSGYRNATVNKAVGGVNGSQHCKGEAADIDTGSIGENRKLARLIVSLGLPFDQLIDENNYAWVHVSYRRVGENRRQILRLKNGVYTHIKEGDL